jgi:hypothetical protein
MAVSAPRMMRMHLLRKLQRRMDRTMDSIGSETISATRRRELATLSLELQRELARLEQMPWPSGRAFVARGDDRPLERRLVCMLRTIRSEPPVPAYAPARFPTRHAPLG